MTKQVRLCDCGMPFVATQDWMYECIICWKLESGYTLTKGDLAFQEMQEAYKKLAVKLTELEASAELSQERILTLITLTHPDKHRDSVVSTEVTKWLLSLRRQGTKTEQE